MIRQQNELVQRIRQSQTAIRDSVVAACEHQALEQLALPVAQEGGDTIFAIDRVSEDMLLSHFTTLAKEWSCVLIAEGLGETGRTVLPAGTAAQDAELVVIFDPIDGTRGIMYQKRSAWILTGVAPNRVPGQGLAFEDQYISTGGQLYELLMGHDRWIADLRPLVEPLLRQRGRSLGLCCHPYDLCTELIAGEAGVIVTDVGGEQLQAPLDVSTEMAWTGYANATLAAHVAPVLQSVLDEHCLIPHEVL